MNTAKPQIRTIGLPKRASLNVTTSTNNAYWERGEQWDYTAAALQGSSYYKLPRVLQWLSGNIGFHHIHHLSPSIPNYNPAGDTHHLVQQLPIT